jgi:hypothetical protein
LPMLTLLFFQMRWEADMALEKLELWKIWVELQQTMRYLKSRRVQVKNVIQ